jgi:MarR-like DNA-binding transcriptional regulator SgrR of sgrS sRNA
VGIRNSDMLDVIEAFKYHYDYSPTLDEIEGLSTQEDRSSLTLLLRLYDNYLFITYPHIYEQAKLFCKTNETKEDDELANSCCYICHQTDSPESSNQCSNKQCPVMYHSQCYYTKDVKDGFDLNNEWFCKLTCYYKFLEIETNDRIKKERKDKKRKRV